LVKISRR